MKTKVTIKKGTRRKAQVKAFGFPKNYYLIYLNGKNIGQTDTKAEALKFKRNILKKNK